MIFVMKYTKERKCGEDNFFLNADLSKISFLPTKSMK